MREIACNIAGNLMRLEAAKGEPIARCNRNRPKEAHTSVRPTGRSRWPWKQMQPGECVLIPWGIVTIANILGAINGYCKNAKGASFSYRSTATGLRVWCKTQSKRNTK